MVSEMNLFAWCLKMAEFDSLCERCGEKSTSRHSNDFGEEQESQTEG